jgi:Methyltransferase domain
MLIQSTTHSKGLNSSAKPGCIACGGAVYTLGKNAGYTYARCESCDTVQLSPFPSQAELTEAYSDSEFATYSHGQGDPDEIRKSSHTYYESIANVLTSLNVSGLVVDYGAGWGGLCELLIERGFRCKGIELAKNMVEECQKRKLPVEQRSIQALAQDGYSAKAVVLCGVFEHLAEPRTFFTDAFTLLESGGFLVSLQPTAPFALFLATICKLGQRNDELPSAFWIFHAPWHVALYSLKGMELIAKDCGFELIDIRWSPQGRVNGFYGIAQRCLELANRLGWSLFRARWPLLTSHTFVCKKTV